MRYKVLLVDDDTDQLAVLKEYLGADAFTVLTAKDAYTAFVTATESRPDIVICDVAMPGSDGFSFARQLRADRRTQGLPLIFMTGTRVAVGDQVDGLDHGGDDYLIKPVVPRVLAARIRAVLRRRVSPEETAETLEGAGVHLDLDARRVTRAGQEVRLTRKEFDLLTTFLRKPGRVLSVAYLLETVWGYDPSDYNDPRTLQVHVSSLRRKLGPGLAKRIESVPGLGYRFA